MTTRVYLGGPDVFAPNSREIGISKIAVCRRYCLEAVFPFVEEARPLFGTDFARQIFGRCTELMDGCDVMIANMTPFRGPSMDVGTAFEMGYMYARGGRVFGYTNVTGDYSTRVHHDGMMVEAFGLADNLMCEVSALDSGGRVFRHAAASSKIWSDLTAFESCVRLIGAE